MTLADRIVVMNDRSIEQVGTPMEIYARPATAFVARFVGSPAMNFAAGERSKRDGSGSRRSCSATARRRRDRASTRRRCPAGRRCSSACAPSRSRVVAAGQRRRPARRSRCVERLGERTLVYVALADGTTIIAEDAGDEPRQRRRHGRPARSTAPRAHLFDADGARLPRGGGRDGEPPWHDAASRHRDAAAWANVAVRRCRSCSSILLLLIYPAARAACGSSLHKADLFGDGHFVGLDNFARLLRRHRSSCSTVWNTFYFVLLTVPALAVIGLALALALNRPTRGGGGPARRSSSPPRCCRSPSSR